MCQYDQKTNQCSACTTLYIYTFGHTNIQTTQAAYSSPMYIDSTGHAPTLTCTPHSWVHTSTEEGSGSWHRLHSWCRLGPSISWMAHTHCDTSNQLHLEWKREWEFHAVIVHNVWPKWHYNCNFNLLNVRGHFSMPNLATVLYSRWGVRQTEGGTYCSLPQTWSWLCRWAVSAVSH